MPPVISDAYNIALNEDVGYKQSELVHELGAGVWPHTYPQDWCGEWQPLTPT